MTDMRFASFISLTCGLLCVAPLCAQQNIIPKPASVQMQAGLEPFVFTASSIIIIATDDAAVKKAAEDFAQMLRQGTGLPLPLIIRPAGTELTAPKAGEIQLRVDQDLLTRDKEAYRIKAQAGLEIDIASPEALVRACASIAQMLPPTFFEDDSLFKQATNWALGEGAFTLVDEPRFAWRAFMLDEARHFFGVEAVKDLLDQMALFKLNVLHWHLTDNDGWRVEIKKYPRLAQIGSKRADTEAGTWRSGKSVGKPHEGFYTQEQIKDIVAYASARGITIVPEFDVPGHSSAASVAYPDLSLKPLKEMPVVFGTNAALDPTKESTYTFVSDVFDELITLFPSGILHFGGDEVRFSKQWKDVPEINEFMKKHGYKSLAEVQMHFTNRVEKMIRAKGKRAMGWNEIMGGDIHGDGGGNVVSTINRDTIIHYWVGAEKHLVTAVKKGHQVVNSFHKSTYMDYDYKKIPLKKCYEFEPVPAGLSPEEQQRVIGMGGQMWTEWTPTLADMQRQVFPRMIALAEVAWTEKKEKNYQDFLRRLKAFQIRLDLQYIQYHKDSMPK